MGIFGPIPMVISHHLSQLSTGECEREIIWSGENVIFYKHARERNDFSPSIVYIQGTKINMTNILQELIPTQTTINSNTNKHYKD